MRTVIRLNSDLKRWGAEKVAEEWTIELLKIERAM